MWITSMGNHGAAGVSQNAGILVVLVVFGPFPPPPFCQHFPGKPLKLISSNHTWLTYGCGKFFWHQSLWPWVKVNKLPKQDTIYLVPMIKWEPLIQSLQNSIGISPSSCFPTGGILLKKRFLAIFFRKILNLVFAIRTFYMYRLVSNIRRTSNIRCTPTLGNSQLEFSPTISLAKTSNTRRTPSFDFLSVDCWQSAK